MLRDYGGVDVHNLSLAKHHLTGGFLQEHIAGCSAPARVGVRKEMADVRLAQRAEHRVADGVHQDVRIRMSIEPLAVRNLNAAEDELSACDQLVNIVTDADVIHAAEV